MPGERAGPKLARIVLARPYNRKAEGTLMTDGIDAAMRRAGDDEGVSVIVLAADGDHFSAGHDLSMEEAPMGEPPERTSLWGEFGAPGWEGLYTREREVYLEMTERWRNAPRPVVAAVQGSVISGG